MKRFIVVLAIVAISGLHALSRETEPVLACTGPGPTENLLESTIIFEGRVVSVTPTEPKGHGLSPSKIVFEVIRGYRGVAGGQTVIANALIPTGEVPLMCAQFPRELAGKYVVIGLQPDPEKLGELVAYASVGYVTDSLAGPEYDAMSRLARMHADSDPAAPQLLVSPGIARCGEPFKLSGRRFPEGKYLLRYSVSTRFAGLADVGPNGSFELEAIMAHERCKSAAWNGRTVAIHAMDVSAGPGTEWFILERLLEIGSVTLAGAVDTPYPTLSVNPNPARCSDILEVRGTWFVPGEQLSLRFGYHTPGVRVTANGSGAFVAEQGIPADACDAPLIEVLVNQAGYEAYTSPFYGLAQVSVIRAGPPPGPPDLGTGPGAAKSDEARISVGALGLVALIAAAVAVLGAMIAKRTA